MIVHEMKLSVFFSFKGTSVSLSLTKHVCPLIMMTAYMYTRLGRASIACGCDFGILNSVFSQKLVKCWISYMNNLFVIFT